MCFFDVRRVVSSELLAESPYQKAIFVACVLRRKIFDLPCYHFKMSIYKIVFISDGRKKGRRSVWLL